MSTLLATEEQRVFEALLERQKRHVSYLNEIVTRLMAFSERLGAEPIDGISTNVKQDNPTVASMLSNLIGEAEYKTENLLSLIYKLEKLA